MATYVLVPGMWLGGWAWREVASGLRAAGHDVYPVTLTGLGEREHLGGPETDLDTHITDVVNVLRYEDLRDVVLVGHSYAALVVTGAADRVPERIARLVYVDTWPLPEGISQADLNPPEARQAEEEQVRTAGSGWRLPLPPWDQLDEGNNLRDLGEAERRQMRERAAGHPYGSATQPVHLESGAWASLPRTVIWCSMTAEEVQGLTEAYPEVCSTLLEPGWQVIELPTGHWPMFSKPRELTDVLAGLS